MSITIKGRPGERVGVTGDIATTLRVPFDEVEERFLLAASDGTLIEGRLDAEEEQYDFRVVVDGAGITRVGRAELTLDWQVEWVTIAPIETARGWSEGLNLCRCLSWLSSIMADIDDGWKAWLDQLEWRPIASYGVHGLVLLRSPKRWLFGGRTEILFGEGEGWAEFVDGMALPVSGFEPTEWTIARNWNEQRT